MNEEAYLKRTFVQVILTITVLMIIAIGTILITNYQELTRL